MVDIAGERCEALARELGRRASPFACDISDPAAVRTRMSASSSALGAVDILVNNAGILSNNKVEATERRRMAPRARRQPRRRVLLAQRGDARR